MPSIIAVAIVIVPLIVLAVAAVDTVRVAARRGGYPAVSLAYHSYAA
jgi:hypothetical protein